MLPPVRTPKRLLPGTPQQFESRLVLHRAVVEREVLEEERQEQEVLDELSMLLELLP